MKLRSRGLGRRELVMDFREYRIARDGDDVVVSGMIHEPVTWDFTIRISGDDIPGMLRVGLHRETLSLAARWVRQTRHRTRAPHEPVPVLDIAARPSRAAARSLPMEAVNTDVVKAGAERSPEPAPIPITRLRRAGAPAVGAPEASVASPPVDRRLPVSTIRTTPDFGAPRRRGGSPVSGVPAARASAGGGGR